MSPKTNIKKTILEHFTLSKPILPFVPLIKVSKTFFFEPIDYTLPLACEWFTFKGSQVSLEHILNETAKYQDWKRWYIYKMIMLLKVDMRFNVKHLFVLLASCQWVLTHLFSLKVWWPLLFFTCLSLLSYQSLGVKAYAAHDTPVPQFKIHFSKTTSSYAAFVWSIMQGLHVMLNMWIKMLSWCLGSSSFSFVLVLWKSSTIHICMLPYWKRIET